MTHYEDPSPEDIKRFSNSETGFCPHCGEELWDDASQCHHCDRWIQTGVLHQDPIAYAFKKKFMTVVVITILIGFFWGVARLF
jgi:hypothetical protein